MKGRRDHSRAPIPVRVGDRDYPSLQAFGREHGLNHDVVRRAYDRGTLEHLLEHGRNPPLKGPYRVRDEEFSSYREIAERFGTTRNTVALRFRKGLQDTIGLVADTRNKPITVGNETHATRADFARSRGVTRQAVFEAEKRDAGALMRLGTGEVLRPACDPPRDELGRFVSYRTEKRAAMAAPSMNGSRSNPKRSGETGPATMEMQ